MFTSINRKQADGEITDKAKFRVALVIGVEGDGNVLYDGHDVFANFASNYSTSFSFGKGEQGDLAVRIIDGNAAANEFHGLLCEYPDIALQVV